MQLTAIIVRPHPQYVAYVRRCGLLLQTCHSIVGYTKTVQAIEMLSGLRTLVGPGNILDGGSDPPREGVILRVKRGGPL